MSIRILKAAELKYRDGENKNYIIMDKVSETFHGTHPGDVLKVIDVSSGETLITGIMCTTPRKQACSDCIFNIAAKPFIVGACDYVPCHSMSMIPMKQEDVLEKL